MGRPRAGRGAGAGTLCHSLPAWTLPRVGIFIQSLLRCFSPRMGTAPRLRPFFFSPLKGRIPITLPPRVLHVICPPRSVHTVAVPCGLPPHTPTTDGSPCSRGCPPAQGHGGRRRGEGELRLHSRTEGCPLCKQVPGGGSLVAHVTKIK